MHEFVTVSLLFHLIPLVFIKDLNCKITTRKIINKYTSKIIKEKKTLITYGDFNFIIL